MTWARIDDAMGEHRKTRRLLRSRGGLGSFGLHTLAIIHCARYLTDGFVEQEFVDDVLDDARVRGKARQELVEALVAGGQWEPAEGGWQIHDYLEHNPSRDAVNLTRGDDRYRKELTRDHALVSAIRQRDGDRCRYCGVDVNWKDRRSSVGGTYDHVIPVSAGGENTFANVVVSCRGCNLKKGPRTPLDSEMPLIDPGTNQVGPSRGADTSSRRGRSDLAASSGARPDPALPDPTHLPPSPPRGNRTRDRERYEQTLQTFVDANFPGVPAGLVAHLASQLRLQRVEPTADALRPLVAQHTGGVAAA